MPWVHNGPWPGWYFDFLGWRFYTWRRMMPMSVFARRWSFVRLDSRWWVLRIGRRHLELFRIGAAGFPVEDVECNAD